MAVHQSVSIDASGFTEIVGSVASGSADSGNGVKISGVYNTTVPSITNGQRSDLQTDSRGALQTTQLDGFRSSYSTSIVALASTTTATDIFTITGSATKTIRVLRIELSYTEAAANFRDILLIKRSTANTGGTSTSPVIGSHDSTNAAATAVVNAYTANPVLGSAVATLRATRLFSTTATGGSTTSATSLIWDFGTRPSQAIVLRGTSQVLAINLNSVTITTGTFDISIEWSEE